MPSLAELKKKRGKNLKTLQEKIEQSNASSGYAKDDRIWKPTFNKEEAKRNPDKGQTAIVRFLPAKSGEQFIEVKSYNFKDKNGHFYALSPQNIGQEDPIQIAAINCFRKAKADGGDERLKKQGIKYMPKSTYYANVYVVSDPEHPDNEGKVFIYQFGRQIYLAIEKAIKPEFDDVEPLDPFDLWEGAEFKIRMVGNEIPDQQNPGIKVLVPSYDKSEFGKTSEFLNGNDDEIDEVFNKTYDLSEFLDPEKHKSFEELAKLFKAATGKDYNWLSADYTEETYVPEKEEESKMSDEQDNNIKVGKSDSGDSKFEEPKEDEASDAVDESGTVDEEEDVLSKFRRLASKSK